MTRDPCMSPTQPGTPTGTRDAGAAPGSSRHPEPRPAAKPKHDTLTHEETVCADAHVPWHHRARGSGGPFNNAHGASPLVLTVVFAGVQPFGKTPTI